LLLLLLLQLLLSSLFLFLVTASTARFGATATAAAAAAGENSAAAVKAGKNFTPYITAAAAGFQPPFPHTAPGGSAAAVGKRIARETVKERVCMASSSFSPEAAAAAAVEEVRISLLFLLPTGTHSHAPPSLPPSLSSSPDTPPFDPAQGHYL